LVKVLPIPGVIKPCAYSYCILVRYVFDISQLRLSTFIR